MQGDDVGMSEQIVQIALLDGEVAGALIGEIRIEDNHPHFQSMSAIGNDRADITAADDAERLAGKLHANVTLLLPSSRMGGRVRLRNFSCQRQDQGDGVFGRGDRVSVRRVHHHDAALRRRRHIDVVHADTGAADHFQPC